MTVTEIERGQVLVGFGGDVVTGRGLLLHKLVDEAAASPGSIAVADAGARIGYGELVERADRLAWALVEAGVRAGSVVAVCLPRSADLVVAELAVLKAGAAYLPLDAADPADRLALMVADAGAQVLICAGGVAPQWAGDRVAVDVAARGASGDPGAGAPDVQVHPENPAYVIYTSGSTGTPKGVMVPHQGITNLVAWHNSTHKITGDDRCALLARVAFDASCWEMWTALAAGATLVAAPETVSSAGGDAVLDWLNDEQITVAFLPPLLAERFYHSRQAATSSMRVLLTGSDRLAQHPPTTLKASVVNHYGPTEYSVIGTAGTVAPGHDGAPTIGTPIDNTRVYILDERGDPVPIGVTGRIHLSGQGTAHGYLNRPALTAERFIPDPFATAPGTRMYDTGDLGRWNPDGTIEYGGRNDRQVKIRGYRIECGEIETQLLTHPVITAAAVKSHTDDNGNARLSAYFETEGGKQVADNDIRSHLQTILPEHMIPATFQTLERLPQNANGKVDYGALPEPHTDRPDTGTEFVAARNDTERTIAQIWSEVLNIDSIGIYDNFFDLGGHSLLATEIIDRIEGELGISGLDVRAVFDYPTIAELTASLD
jgi:amino acid adenylation domain-containing protein